MTEKLLTVKVSADLVEKLRQAFNCPNTPAVYVVDQSLRALLDDLGKLANDTKPH